MDSNGSWFSSDVGDVAQPERKIARPNNRGSLDNLRHVIFIVFSFKMKMQSAINTYLVQPKI